MKKNNQILIGTHNKGKFKELSFLLPKKLKKIAPSFLNIKSPAETGKSYSANSKIKAIHFCKYSKLNSISDDSGLSINCLNGKPGIYSARWAKRYGGFYKAMQKIIKMVEIKNKKNKKKNKEAEFICSISFKKYKGKTISAIGRIKGNISNKIIGKNGFGYDSIFIPKKYKITFGQMSKGKKILIDHRFIAYRALTKKVRIG